MKPLVSICIPTYNGAEYLRECLDAVQAQTYPAIEIIVVDDCSTDETRAMIEQYAAKDQRIQLFVNEKNRGLVGNWNRCLELAKGEWIKFIFQDDLVTPDCIEKLVDAAGAHSFVTCDRHFLFDTSVPQVMKDYYLHSLLTLKKMKSGKQPQFIDAKEMSDYAAAHISLNFIGEPTAVLFRKEAIGKYGFFNDDLSQICDLEYWLRIATAEGMVYVPEELVSFRIHASSTTSQNIIASTKFKPRYIDVIVFAHELLYGAAFKSFQSQLSFSKRKKIEYFIMARMQDAKKAFEENKGTDRQFFDQLFLRYPALKAFYSPSFAAKLVSCGVMLRRKWRSR